ncbi:MAG: DUF4861 domain-containing protein [candidate division KSB1 bacterium]|nr:DUF4861 domain-containing protein [candidate division KSB1 bacterium]MDZ7273538.1 DUF4861 domain-containing protein [candidate division KSB1 bacterium]MDZ7286871.1 DUF4861 domain-containing protein [candidate division KSB1 bacterium]MDZ7299776.1 DUF4861 domain-containing protein [candidate division KSB1 bacterium]MDZ7307659.1 DUF4861 domain-containing protein [candidate division KSB1 bacterium]
MLSLRIFAMMTLVAIFPGYSQWREVGAVHAQAYPETLAISVKNPAGFARLQTGIVFDMVQLKAKAPAFNPGAFVVLSQDGELAGQAVDGDGNGSADQIVCVADFAPYETKTLTVRYAKSGVLQHAYPKRTQAELSHKVGGKFVNRKYEGGTFQNVQYLRVPSEHTDHSFYIRYEGPGWESDKIGYRFYLDWRNAIDIFGKKTPSMVLQNVGQDGFDSYHEMSDWGMDILKVGESLGIGSLAMWHAGKAQRIAHTDSVTCAIIANGAVYSQIQTKYFGWKAGGGRYNVVSNLAITAGSRLTKHAVEISGNPENLCTGIVKFDSTRLLASPPSHAGWAYLATYGKQSLANDKLGLAVLYRKHDLIEVRGDQYSHVVVFKPANGQLTYYFLAAWEQEPNGIKAAEEFETYLNQTVAELNSPLVIE